MFHDDVGKVLLQVDTSSLLLNSETGEVIMDLPIAYDPDGTIDVLYF